MRYDMLNIGARLRRLRMEYKMSAGAVYKIDGIALVNCELFDRFLETFREF